MDTTTRSGPLRLLVGADAQSVPLPARGLARGPRSLRHVRSRDRRTRLRAIPTRPSLRALGRDRRDAASRSAHCARVAAAPALRADRSRRTRAPARRQPRSRLRRTLPGARAESESRLHRARRRSRLDAPPPLRDARHLARRLGMGQRRTRRVRPRRFLLGATGRRELLRLPLLARRTQYGVAPPLLPRLHGRDRRRLPGRQARRAALRRRVAGALGAADRRRARAIRDHRREHDRRGNSRRSVTRSAARDQRTAKSRYAAGTSPSTCKPR